MIVLTQWSENTIAQRYKIERCAFRTRAARDHAKRELRFTVKPVPYRRVKGAIAVTI